MLTPSEELKLNGLIAVTKDLHEAQFHISMTTENWQWLASKLKELNDELKGSCTGEERHRHWSLDKKSYIYHSHPHDSRHSVDFNIFHHHPPADHRKQNE